MHILAPGVLAVVINIHIYDCISINCVSMYTNIEGEEISMNRINFYLLEQKSGEIKIWYFSIYYLLC